jgi:hypothetical protein
MSDRTARPPAEALLRRTLHWCGSTAGDVLGDLAYELADQEKPGQPEGWHRTREGRRWRRAQSDLREAQAELWYRGEAVRVRLPGSGPVLTMTVECAAGLLDEITDGLLHARAAAEQATRQEGGQ